MVSKRKKWLQALANRRVLVRHQGCLWHLAEVWDRGMLIASCGEEFRPGGWDEDRHLEDRDLVSPAKALICEECLEAIVAEKVAEAMMEKSMTFEDMVKFADRIKIKSGGATRRGGAMEVRDVP
jgi:hypothetical protein